MTDPKNSISVADAISALESETTDDVIEWQQERLKERRADAGGFAFSKDVRTLVGKFIPNG